MAGLLAGLLAAGAAVAAGAPAPLVLAVHPYLPAEEITRRFTPLAEALARSTGRAVVVRVGVSYAEHIAAIGTGSVDIAYMGPALYVRMTGSYGPKPLLARQVINGDPARHGEIIVRQDSAIRSLQDLKGKRFAFSDPEATSGHVVPAAMLRDAGVPESALAQSAYLHSYRNVALAVLAGDFDAGAVREEIYREYAPRGLRTLAHQPAVADHLFVASSGLSGAEVDALRRAFMELPGTPQGKVAMIAIDPAMTALVAARDSDYDNLRALMRLPASVPHPRR
ncbi:MAG TPA: phosphate/phosphite/phosphonate ABC transporter substrate-binding protein [Steroidobacteraceae bacterium]|nr:phosphate/phosphite/phosphonate ABC transporter substrate-binding protein [Steroidobacteraceae bacterium]